MSVGSSNGNQCRTPSQPTSVNTLYPLVIIGKSSHLNRHVKPCKSSEVQETHKIKAEGKTHQRMNAYKENQHEFKQWSTSKTETSQWRHRLMKDVTSRHHPPFPLFTTLISQIHRRFRMKAVHIFASGGLEGRRCPPWGLRLRWWKTIFLLSVLFVLPELTCLFRIFTNLPMRTELSDLASRFKSSYVEGAPPLHGVGSVASGRASYHNSLLTAVALPGQEASHQEKHTASSLCRHSRGGSVQRW